MNTPTWAQLHAMEPGLRPVGEGPAEGWEFTLRYFPATTRGPEHWAWHCARGDGGFSPQPSFIVPALSRDRAAEWIELNARGSCWSLHYYESVGWKWDDNVPGTFPTRDEALRAACAAVIGERKPLKPCCTPGGCRCSRPSEPETPS